MLTRMANALPLHALGDQELSEALAAVIDQDIPGFWSSQAMPWTAGFFFFSNSNYYAHGQNEGIACSHIYPGLRVEICSGSFPLTPRNPWSVFAGSPASCRGLVTGDLICQ